MVEAKKLEGVKEKTNKKVYEVKDLNILNTKNYVLAISVIVLITFYFNLNSKVFIKKEKEKSNKYAKISLIDNR